MTREEAIEQLKGLQAEHEGSRLYLPIGEAPELRLPLPWSRVGYVAWEGERWRVTHARQYPSGAVMRLADVERDTLDECVEWLARRE